MPTSKPAKPAVAKTTAKTPVKTAARRKTSAAPAARKPPAAKPAVATKPASKAPAAKPVKPAKPAKPVAAPAPSKPPKAKLVRDSFTMPKAEYAVIDALKQRGAKLAKPVKKSELLRAGVKALAAMSDEQFLAAVVAVPAIKTGRPKVGKPVDKPQDKPVTG